MKILSGEPTPTSGNVSIPPGTRVLEITGRRVVDHPGSHDDYLAHREALLAAA